MHKFSKNKKTQQQDQGQGSSRAAAAECVGNEGGHRQRVFTNKNVSGTPKQTGVGGRSGDVQNPNYFGTMIPDEVMEDVLFRFLNSIPDNEKESHIRVCFHIEQAHWFFVDFYCSAGNGNNGGGESYRQICKEVGFREFVRQVFYKCDYLDKWRESVEYIVDEFRRYKSNVPTYGVIMLDSTLNYILLVQGYYASKNSWGFPKGKVNEDEVPLQCAIREAYEEVGFDVTDYVSDKIRPLQCFINDTLVRLYIATDVPMDFPFQPHLRKEIRKISWFSVWDLPKDRSDDKSCARLGLNPNNFYSMLPFVHNICAFIQREQAKRNKPRQTVLNLSKKERHGSSAFEPVIPRASSQTALFNPISATASFSGENFPPTIPSPSEGAMDPVTSENVFKPVKLDPSNQPPASFTGQSFLEAFLKEQTKRRQQASPSASTSSEQMTPAQNLGVIGGESQHRRKEIKQPKPLHSAHQLIFTVYEAPPEPGSGGGGQPTKPSPPSRKKSLVGGQRASTEIADMLISSITTTAAGSVERAGRFASHETAEPTPESSSYSKASTITTEHQIFAFESLSPSTTVSNSEKRRKKKPWTSRITPIQQTQSPMIMPQSPKQMPVDKQSMAPHPVSNVGPPPAMAPQSSAFTVPPPPMGLGCVMPMVFDRPPPPINPANFMPHLPPGLAGHVLPGPPPGMQMPPNFGAASDHFLLAPLLNQMASIPPPSLVDLPSTSSAAGEPQPDQQSPLMKIQLCEAWKKFTFDWSRVLAPTT